MFVGAQLQCQAPPKALAGQRLRSSGQLVVHPGVATVVVGAGHDRIIFEQIKQQVNNAAALHDLVDASPLFELPSLAQRSLGVLGVDTGPMHLLAATHVPTVVLFSGFRSPTLCAPRGRAVRVLEAEKLSVAK